VNVCKLSQTPKNIKQAGKIVKNLTKQKHLPGVNSRAARGGNFWNDAGGTGQRLASLASGIIKGQQPMFRSITFVIGAAALATINFYLSFVRPYFHHSRHVSMEGYRNVSGIPIIGTVLGFVGAVFGFGAIGTAVIGIAAFVMDTGGSG
jgi:hypothetical protein